MRLIVTRGSDKDRTYELFEFKTLTLGRGSDLAQPLGDLLLRAVPRRGPGTGSPAFSAGCRAADLTRTRSAHLVCPSTAPVCRDVVVRRPGPLSGRPSSLSFPVP